LTVIIVVIARLAYRKGIDLFVAAAPQICAQFPDVRFIVGTTFLHAMNVRYRS
jgi:phosphatidylinositol glycan class A protein